MLRRLQSYGVHSGLYKLGIPACSLIYTHEPVFVFLFSVQQDATETW